MPKVFQYRGRGAGARPMTVDAASSSGMAFLESELEKLDPTLREPLTSSTYPRDIMIEPGGGWMEFASSMYVDYAKTGGSGASVVGGAGNAIPVIQAETTKDLFKFLPYQSVMQVKYIDMQKGNLTNRSLEDMYDNGIRLDFDKFMDLNVYVGFEEYETFGLLNNPNVFAALAAATGTGSSTKWADKEPEQILDDINQAITAAWEASEYDNSAMVNHILIDPGNYARLATSKVGTYNDKTILSFLQENNMAKEEGSDLTIKPCRWCKGAGTGATDRMLIYRNEKRFVSMDLAVPLARVMTSPNTMQAAYDSLYAANVGQVKVHYTEPMRYVDGI